MRRLAGLLLIGLLMPAHAEGPVTAPSGGEPTTTLAIVVAATDQSARADRAMIALAYRRKRQFWPDGRRIHPINLPAAHPLRLQFSNQMLGASPAALVDYWNAEYFLGILPPYVAASPAALVARVAGTPGAVGYVDGCTQDPRLRVLFFLHSDGRSDADAPAC